MKVKYWVFIFLILSIIIRLFLNFSHELIPGVNGGYYPLQVRSIITNGHLGFSDMPILFYFNAAIIKIISFLGFKISDLLIIYVVKIVDSISLPLMIFPLYRIMRLSQSIKIVQIGILAFSVLSFSALVLTSDLQKNALALTFMLTFISYFISFQNNGSKADVFYCLFFVILTGLTHFGTFVFGLFFLLFMVLFMYKKRAIIPMTLIAALGLGIVYLVDIYRFKRLISIWNLIFEKPALFNGMMSPPDFIIILLSFVLGFIGIFTFYKKRENLSAAQKSILVASIISLLVCSFPLLDSEYFKRLSLFLFIPQMLIILQISSVIKIKQQRIIGFFLLFFVVLSVFAMLGKRKNPVISKSAYEDLKNMQSVINREQATIVIARHGLEWWTAWALNTNVGQDKAIDRALFEKYEKIILLNQISGFDSQMEKNPIHEPFVPPNSTIIFSSDYFKAFLIQPQTITKRI